LEQKLDDQDDQFHDEPEESSVRSEETQVSVYKKLLLNQMMKVLFQLPKANDMVNDQSK